MPKRVLTKRGVRRSIFGLGSAALLAGLAVAATIGWLNWRYQPPTAAMNVAEMRAEVDSLREQRDSLQTRLVDAQNQSDLLDRRPSGDVLIALPTAFVSSIMTDVITGWFHEVDLRLRNLHVGKDGTVKARLGVLGRRTVGDYALRIHIVEVTGRLEPDPPQLTFGGDSIGIVLPVRLVGGEGHGELTFDWDSRGLARAVCGDLTAERPIAGTVMPQRYIARGRLQLSASEGGVLADPEFPGLAMRLRIRPSPASLRALEILLESKGPLCDIATSKGNVETKVLELVGRGFLVKIPQKFFRPLRLPISVQEELPMLDRQVSLTATPDTLVITKQAVWISANVAVRRVPKSVKAP